MTSIVQSIGKFPGAPNVVPNLFSNSSTGHQWL